MFNRRICPSGRHVLWEDMSYKRAYYYKCLLGGHVLWEDMSYRRTCFTGEHVLLEEGEQIFFDSSIKYMKGDVCLCV